jgi:hypothetical protein
MADQLVIEDPIIARQIQQIAQQEQRSIEDVLVSMVTQYRPPSGVGEIPDAEEMARYVRLTAYKRARDYWDKTRNIERAAMTDEQLDEEFWLFDADGIPRLKADKNKVELPASSLHQAGQVLRSAGFRSGQTDISARSREILNDEFTEYLLSRMKQSTDDASNSPAT